MSFCIIGALPLPSKGLEVACWATPLLVASLTLAEMLYLLFSVVTGNWSNALASVVLYFVSVFLVNALGDALSKAGVC